MKLRQRSHIALVSSIAIHILLLLVLSIMGAFSILDKKNQPVEIVFFDSVNAGGSGGGGATPKAAPQTSLATNAVDTQAIADPNTKQHPTAPSSSSTSTNATGVEATADNGSGSGNGVGTGSGDGTGTGDGTGSGSGSGISNNPAVPPRVVRHIAPDYPASVRSAGITGLVKLQVLIDSSGDVQDVEIYESSNHQALDNAAIRAVRNWQFTAAKDNAGRRVACYTIIPIRFNLKN